jgi:predicted  nucleic acid-binding Zn-ribbon protein
MKRFLLLCTLVSLFSSCGGGVKGDEQLMNELDSLKRVSRENEQLTESYLSDLNEISVLLEQIKQKEQMVSLTAENPELTPNDRVKIERDLNDLRNKMDENRKELDQLKRRIAADGREMKSLQALVSSLQKQLEQKEIEIRVLETQLEQMNFLVKSMGNQLDSSRNVNTLQAQTLDEQVKALNTAFYCWGSFRELKDAGIIDAGGLFNAKSGARLSSSFDQQYFTRADIRQLKQLKLNTRKARLASTHPEGSYVLNMGSDRLVESLEITDATAFWSASKYLVIIID